MFLTVQQLANTKKSKISISKEFPTTDLSYEILLPIKSGILLYKNGIVRNFLVVSASLMLQMLRLREEQTSVYFFIWAWVCMYEYVYGLGYACIGTCICILVNKVYFFLYFSDILLNAWCELVFITTGYSDN